MKSIQLIFLIQLIILSALRCVNAELFSDDFSSNNYSGGTNNWASNWTEINDDNNPSYGDVKIVSQRLQITQSNNGISRNIDLSGTINASLSFRYESVNFNTGNGNEVYLEFYNGNNWSIIETFTANSNTIFNIDIPVSYLTANFKLRVVTSSTFDRWNYWYWYWYYTPTFTFDDVVISATSLSSPTIEYRFDETSWNGTSNEVVDSSGNSKHATADASSSTSTSADAKMCRAASFNGTNQFIKASDLSALRGTASLSFWIKTPDASGVGLAYRSPGVTGIEQSGGTNDIFWGWLDPNGKIGITTGNDDTALSTTSINKNVYRHIVLTRNATTHTYKIYIDGTLNKSGTYTDAGDDFGTISTIFNDIGVIRNTSGSGDQFLNALIDEFLVFNSVLTDADVSTIYNLQSSGKNLDGSTRDCGTPVVQQCITTNFDAGFENNWATTTRSGSFGEPRIVNGRLRLTDASRNNSSAATLLKLFPASGNKIKIEFMLYTYGGNGADGITFAFSDSEITPQPGAYGGSLGYAQRSGIDGFAGGWVGIGFDEFGNFLTSNEGRNGGLSTLVTDTVTIRGSGSAGNGYRYITSNGRAAGSSTSPTSLNPGVDISATDANNNRGHKYRIIIDHENNLNAWVSVERDDNLNGSYTTLVQPFDLLAQSGQATIPSKLYLTITGSTGGKTNIHEIDDLNICANSIEGINVAEIIDHYELDRDYQQGLTCEPLLISSRACLDEACSSQVTTTVTTEFSPAAGWLGSNTKTDYSSGDIFDFQQTMAGTYTLDVLSSIPSLKPLSTADLVTCFVAGSKQANCEVNFVDTAYRFFEDSNGASIPLINTIAGNPTSPLYLRAIATDEATGQCVNYASSNVSVPSALGTQCSSTGSCVMGEQVIFTQGNSSTNVANPNDQISGSDTSNVNIQFSSNDTAAFTLTAPDIGLQPLTIQSEILDVDGNATGRFIEGTLNIQSRPKSLVISSTDVGTTYFAGEEFSTIIHALDVNDNPVPSFGRITNLYDIDWTDSTLAGPTGGVMGTIFGDNVGSSSANQWTGTDTGSDGISESITFSSGNGVSYSEVGEFNLVATIDDFLNWGYPITSPQVEIGRFIPAYLIASQEATTAQWGSEDSNVYQGQAAALTGLSYTLTAYNTLGDVTYNYVGDYANFSAKTNVIEKPDALMATGGSVVSNLTWAMSNDTDFDGAITLTAVLDDLVWNRNSSGPTVNDIGTTVNSMTLLTNAIQDDDGICLKTATSGLMCQEATATLEERTLYYVRAALPEQIDATETTAYIDLTLQALDVDTNGNFIFSTQVTDNDLDNTIFTGLAYDSAQQCSLASADCAAIAASTQSPSTFTNPTETLTNLTAGLGLFKATATSSVSGLLELELMAPDWLTWDWNGDGTDELARTLIVFGQYEGRAPVLYTRPGYR